MILSGIPIHATPASVKAFAAQNKLSLTPADITQVVGMVNDPAKPVVRATYNALVAAYSILNILGQIGAGVKNTDIIGGYVSRRFPLMNSGDDNKDLVFNRAVDYRMCGLFPPGILYNMPWNEKNGKLLAGKLWFVPAPLAKFIIEPFDLNPHIDDDPLAWFGPLLSVVSTAIPALGPLAFAANLTGAINSDNALNTALAVFNATGMPNSLAQSILPDGASPLLVKTTVATAESTVTGGNPIIAAAGTYLPGLAQKQVQNIFTTTIDTPVIPPPQFLTSNSTIDTPINSAYVNPQPNTPQSGATKMATYDFGNGFSFDGSTDSAFLPDPSQIDSSGGMTNFDSGVTNARDYFAINNFGQGDPMTGLTNPLDLLQPPQIAVIPGYTPMQSSIPSNIPATINPGQWGVFAGDLAKTATGALVQYVAQKNAAGKSVLTAKPFVAPKQVAQNVLPAQNATSTASMMATAKTYAVPLLGLAAFLFFKG